MSRWAWAPEFYRNPRHNRSDFHSVPGQSIPRQRLTPELKQEVMRRDGMACRYCGVATPDGVFDHIHPHRFLGPTTTENLAWACRPCNRSKGSWFLMEWLSRQIEDLIWRNL